MTECWFEIFALCSYPVEISCKLNETLSLHYLTATIQLNSVFWMKEEGRCERMLVWDLRSLLLPSRYQLQTEWNIIIILFNDDNSTEQCILNERGGQMWLSVGLRSSLIWDFTQDRLVVFLWMFVHNLSVSSPNSSTDFTNYLKYTLFNEFVKPRYQFWPASLSSGQGLWLLIMRSRVRFPVLPWEFVLAGKDSRGDHGLGS